MDINERAEKLSELMDSLDDAQLGPVMKLEGNLLVEAGAGSGKTKVLVNRVYHMLLCGILAENILMITFTNKAASEMKERLIERLEGTKVQINSGTFHSIGIEVLREYIDYLGRDNNFRVMEESESKKLIGRIIKELGYDDVLKAKEIQEILGLSMNKLSRVSEIVQGKINLEEVKDKIQEVGKEYMSWKRDINVLDYDDILYYWYLLMKKEPRVRKEIQEKYKYILIDEYQDTNKLQDEIVKLIESGNLMLVGDVNQSIYKFRGGDIENILNYRNREGLHIFRLENNYRSSGRIVEVSKEVISKNQNRGELEVKSVRGMGDKLKICRSDTRSVEADYIINEYIPELLSKGSKLSDIAILYRNHELGQEIEKLMMKTGYNYELKRDKKLVEREHIKDVLGYLKFLNNLSDMNSLKRVLKSVKGVGVKTEEKIEKHLLQTGEMNLDSLSIKNKDLKIVEYLYNKHQLILNNNGNLGFKDCLGDYYREHYRKYLGRKGEEEEIEYSKDIMLLMDGIDETKTLNEYLNDILINELNVESKEKEEKIFLSTIHRSKGLEFKDVILVGCNDGKLPSYTSMGNVKLMEEERRLFYVALTRAKESFLMSYVSREYRWNVGGQVSLDVSRFLLEISEKHYDHYDIT